MSQPSDVPPSANSGTESFFTRLRAKSLSTLAPDAGLKEAPIQPAEDAWSSDSSSDDDLVDVSAGSALLEEDT
jgi:hypothetical protein